MRVGILSLISLSVVGCQERRIYIDSRVPILTVNDLPNLEPFSVTELSCLSPEIVEKLKTRDKTVKESLLTYKRIIDTYNIYAEQRNKSIPETARKDQ